MSTYNVPTWAQILAGGPDALQRRQRVLTQFHDALAAARAGKVQKEHLNRQQQYLRALHVWNVLQQCRMRFGWSEKEFQLAVASGGESGPFIVHDMMFVGTLRTLCSEQQWEQWGKAAAAGAITGCYSQTELSHGSDVSSIQTLALFTPSSKTGSAGTLTLHTPCLGATKWWSGGQGNAAQFAIVFAQLCVPVVPPAGQAHLNWGGVSAAAAAAAACSASGETLPTGSDQRSPSSMSTGHVHRVLGVVPIFVPIRDLLTHEPLPGVTVGDLGPKFGFGEVDNGFMQLRGVCVPAEHILAKAGALQLQPQAAPGQAVAAFTPAAGGTKAAYAGMLFERVAMVGATVHALAVASTVAARYSLTRRQFRDTAQPRRPAQHLLLTPQGGTHKSVLNGYVSTPSDVFCPATVRADPSDAAGALVPRAKETLVMQYQTQNTRVCSAIALTLVTHAVSDFLSESHSQLTAVLSPEAKSNAADRASSISALHGLASGVKAVLSETASAALEACRRSCGGHGYMAAGGLGGVYSAYVHVATAGGDTYVLTQQAYKLLVGAHLGMGPREGGGYAVHAQAYLAQAQVASASARRSDLQHTSMKSAHDTTLGNAIHVNGPLWLSHPVALVLALRRVAVRCTAELSQGVSKMMEGGLAAAGLGDSTAPLSFAQACLALQVMGIDAVWAHVLGVMLEVAVRRAAAVLAAALPADGSSAPHSDQWWAHLQFLGVGVPTGALDVAAAVRSSPVVQAAEAAGAGALGPHDALVATRTLMVFGLHCMLHLAPAAMRTGVMSPAEAGHCRAAWTTLCSACVPDALPLLDSLAVPDRSLPGCLGGGFHHSLLAFRGRGGVVPGFGGGAVAAYTAGSSGNDDTVYRALLASACSEPLNNVEHRTAASRLVRELTQHGQQTLEGGVGGAAAKL